MSDVSASIRIGGSIDGPGRAALAEAVVAERVSWDWSGPTIDDEGDVVAALREAAAEGETLALYDDGSRFGRMDAIEHACREHGLHYARHREPSDDGDGDVTFWRPGMAEPKTVTSDADGKATVVAGELLIAVEAAVASGADPMSALREQLEAVTIPSIPVLVLSGDPA